MYLRLFVQQCSLSYDDLLCFQVGLSSEELFCLVSIIPVLRTVTSSPSFEARSAGIPFSAGKMELQLNSFSSFYIPLFFLVLPALS